jgi:hypothetical protein
VLKAIRHRFPWLRHIFADGGYAGDKLRSALSRMIVSRSARLRWWSFRGMMAPFE